EARLSFRSCQNLRSASVKEYADWGRPKKGRGLLGATFAKGNAVAWRLTQWAAVAFGGWRNHRTVMTPRFSSLRLVPMNAVPFKITARHGDTLYGNNEMTTAVFESVHHGDFTARRRTSQYRLWIPAP